MSTREFLLTQKPAATNTRTFRSFLLMAQFEAQEIGARIALARKEAGFTQEELAQIAPFSQRSLQDYEAGKITPYRHLRDLSRLLKRPTEWFLYGDEEEPVPVVEQMRALEERLQQAIGELPTLIAEAVAVAIGSAGEEARPWVGQTRAQLDRQDEILEAIVSAVGDLKEVVQHLVETHEARSSPRRASGH